MKRATMTFPDDLAQALDNYVRAQETPPRLTTVVQAALRQYLRERGFLKTYRPLKITPKGSSGRRDVSQNHDLYLTGMKRSPAPCSRTQAANDKSDELHERALRELQGLARSRREVLLAYPVLLECYSLLLFRLGRNAAAEWLTEVGGASFVNPTPQDYGRAFNTVRTLTDEPLTLVDATVAALALRLELEVWTYDHHFDAKRVPLALNRNGEWKPDRTDKTSCHSRQSIP